MKGKTFQTRPSHGYNFQVNLGVNRRFLRHRRGIQSQAGKSSLVGLEPRISTGVLASQKYSQNQSRKIQRRVRNSGTARELSFNSLRLQRIVRNSSCVAKRVSVVLCNLSIYLIILLILLIFRVFFGFVNKIICIILKPEFKCAFHFRIADTSFIYI